MYEVVLVRARNLQQLVASIRRRAEDGWQVCGLGQEKKKKYNKHLRWYAVMQTEVNVSMDQAAKTWGAAKKISATSPAGGFNVRDMVKEHETASSLPADVLPLSERRARAGDPATYRPANWTNQKEPDPQS